MLKQQLKMTRFYARLSKTTINIPVIRSKIEFFIFKYTYIKVYLKQVVTFKYLIAILNNISLLF